MQYKIYENLQHLDDSDAEACDNNKFNAVYRISWEIQKFALIMSASLKTQIDNSVKDLLAFVWANFLKFGGEAADAKLTKEIFKE